MLGAVSHVLTPDGGGLSSRRKCLNSMSGRDGEITSKFGSTCWALPNFVAGRGRRENDSRHHRSRYPSVSRCSSQGSQAAACLSSPNEVSKAKVNHKK